MSDGSDYDQTPQPLNGTFMGSKPPIHHLNKEQPWHRVAAFAFAMGATCAEVARKMRKSEVAVQNLLRQTWFQEEVTKVMAEYGSRDLTSMFQAEQFNSLTTLIQLRDDANTPAAARIVCARDILDRALGKPVQRVEATGFAHSEDPVAEAEQLTQEINRLRREVTPP